MSKAVRDALRQATMVKQLQLELNEMERGDRVDRVLPLIIEFAKCTKKNGQKCLVSLTRVDSRKMTKKDWADVRSELASFVESIEL